MRRVLPILSATLGLVVMQLLLSSVNGASRAAGLAGDVTRLIARISDPSLPAIADHRTPKPEEAPK